MPSSGFVLEPLVQDRQAHQGVYWGERGHSAKNLRVKFHVMYPLDHHEQLLQCPGFVERAAEEPLVEVCEFPWVGSLLDRIHPVVPQHDQPLYEICVRRRVLGKTPSSGRDDLRGDLDRRAFVEAPQEPIRLVEGEFSVPVPAGVR